MSYITAFLIGVIGGISLNIFLPDFFSKRRELKGKLWATKEDISKITKELEEIKHIYKNDDLLKAEKEFYDESGIE